MNEKSTAKAQKLQRLAELCGVSLGKAADHAHLSRRTYQNWLYNDITPTPHNYERMWNAVIELAGKKGHLTQVVKDRVEQELGVKL